MFISLFPTVVVGLDGLDPVFLPRDTAVLIRDRDDIEKLLVNLSGDGDNGGVGLLGILSC